ncbi:MAG: DUF2723 domain-containing protein [Candidatus Eremiobacterota bacterium]
MNCSDKVFYCRRILFILSSFFIPFIFYVIFLCPTIAGGDSAELITACAVTGIPHPPGYPLYTLLGKIFTFIPLYSIAWRVNLLSAFLSALCCMFIYLSLEILTKNPVSSLCGSLCLAFSRYFWHYSEVSEVFPLNNMFVSILIYILIVWRESSYNDRYIYLAAFTAGLSMTNHHTAILFIPAMIFFLIYNKNIFKKKILCFSVIAFLAGLIPYIYLPVAAMKEPPLNWKNPVTIKNFKELVFRKNYGTMSLIPEKFLKEHNLKAPSLYKKFSVYIASFYCQFRMTGILLAITGFIYLLFKDLPFNMFLLTGIFFTGFFFVSIANMPFEIPLLVGVLQRFYIMSAVFFSFYTGFGVKFLLDFFGKFSASWYIIISVIIVFICFFVPFISNMDEADFRNNYLAFDYGKNILSPLPQSSILFVKGDLPSMTSDYLQMAEGFRKDVKVIDYVKLRYDWYTEEIKKRYPDMVILQDKYEDTSSVDTDLISLNIKNFDIFVTEPQRKTEKFTETPYGMTWKISDKNSINEEIQKENFKFIVRGLEKNYEISSWEYEIKRQYERFGIIGE